MDGKIDTASLIEMPQEGWLSRYAPVSAAMTTNTDK
jgi:hypothetical protein